MASPPGLPAGTSAEPCYLGAQERGTDPDHPELVAVKREATLDVIARSEYLGDAHPAFLATPDPRCAAGARR